jgi:hypothetical protein
MWRLNRGFYGRFDSCPFLQRRDYAVPTMVEGVPLALHPPVEPALAKAVESIPGADALPGGCFYEMKWDGFIHWTLSMCAASRAHHPENLLEPQYRRRGRWPGFGP